MGTNVLKEFRALIWKHPFIACCFLVLFTPPFFPVLRFFFPLLISTALFIVAIVTMGPHLRDASIDNEEEQLKPRLPVEEEVWVDKTVHLNDLQGEVEHEETSWQLVKTEETVGAGGSSPSDPTCKESGKKCRWMDLRRIYEEKGINWIEKILFRNQNWKGAGINDENVSILQEAFPHRDEQKEQTHMPLSEKSSDKSTGAPELLPELLRLSDSSELFLKGFEALDQVDVPSVAENQALFVVLAPADLHEDLNAFSRTATLASITSGMPRLEITDRDGSADDNNRFREVYESDDAYDEDGHSDLETGSPMQANAPDEEVKEACEALIHAPQEHGIVSAAAKVIVAAGEQPPPEEEDIALGKIHPAGSVFTPVRESHHKVRFAPPVLAEYGEVGSLPVPIESMEDGACLVSVMQEDSSATEREKASEHLCRGSGSDNGLEDLKLVSTTNEANRISLPGTTIGKDSMLVGTGIDKWTPNLATNMEICEERCVPSVDATLGDEGSEVLSDRKLHCEEVSRPATEMQGERFVQFARTHENLSLVAASKFGGEGYEERSTPDVSKTDEETRKTKNERLGLHNRTDSLHAAEIHRQPSSLAEEIVLHSVESYKKPLAPWTNTSLQTRSGNTLSWEISAEGVSEIIAHNHKEKLIIPTTEVPEQTGSHDVPLCPKHEEGSSIPAAEELCLDDTAGQQAHIELPVAESVLSVCA